MDPVPPPPALPPDVQPGVTCLLCGYDLQGLGTEGNCPECGAPISFSLRGDFYRFCDPGRLNRMALGGTLIAGTLLVAVPGWFGLNLLDRVASPLSRTGTMVAAGCAVWILTHAIGWWLLTEHEPAAPHLGVNGGSESNSAKGERARVWTREAVLFFVLASLGAIVVGAWRSSVWGMGTFMPGRQLAAGLWLAAIVASVGVLLTGTRYMMAMGRRLPPGKLGPRAEFLFLYIATISGMMAVSAALAGAFYGLGIPHASMFLGQTCACMSGPLWLVALGGVMMAAYTSATALRRERDIGLALRRRQMKETPGEPLP